ncbi:hypothetical protein [Streptomyces sp. NPDC091879]|uniref:hypothetical protein n=1 Tax=Streptomyces sp. NPDC091879 TaxID=3366006 RepID=UPI00382BD8D2
MDLTNATPAEIDTALYAAYVKTADLTAQQQRAQQFINIIDDTEPGSHYSHLPSRSPERRAELVAEIERLQERIQEILQGEIYPREARYHSRRWTRYYLVDNTNGHVHKDQACDTCFPTTQYAWLIEQSGMTAEDLVELAGEKACTRCFPWAPTDTLKRKTRLESVDKKAARLEREAKKAEREAKKAAKAIANPDGTPLKTFDHHWPERQVVRNGKVVKVHPAHDSYKTLETLHAARGWLTDAIWYLQRDGESHPSFTAADQLLVAEAIAHKEGKTRETVLAEAKKRAARR